MNRFTAVLATAVLILAPASAWGDPVYRQLTITRRVDWSGFAPGLLVFLRVSIIDGPNSDANVLLTTGEFWTKLHSHILQRTLGEIDASIFERQLWVRVERKVSDGSWLDVGRPVPLRPVPYALSAISLPSASVTSVETLDGSIVSDDLAAGTVTDDKLATITGAGKVAASALPAGIVMTDTVQAVTGVKTFNPAAGGVPFAVGASGNGMVANLRAARAGDTDNLGGHSLAGLGVRYGAVPPSPAGTLTGYLETTLDGGGVVGPYSSIAIGVDGLPVISYYDFTNGDLKVAKCNDPACSGGDQTISTVDSAGNVGRYSLIAIGTDGFPVISYLDGVPNHDLKVAKCNDPACSGGDETVSTVDSAGNSGYHSSMAIGSDGLPVISYVDDAAGILKVAKCNDPACSGNDETISTVDSSPDVGYGCSLTIGTDGFPVISYYDSTNGDLKVAKCNDPACSGNDETISTVDGALNVGAYSSIALGPDGLPVISYYDYSHFALKVAKCNDTACSGGDETLSTVDGVALGERTSITIGSDGFPVISYQDIPNYDLKVAKCNDPACSGGDETLATVDSTGSVGQLSSITIGPDGLWVVSYYDFTNGDLKVARQFTRPLGRR